MEHLDLASVLSTNNCGLPAFDQQDAIYLCNSRQMLEPILEETSEDEEHAQNSWNQYENTHSFWSSAESETGSVIRIEITKDSDTISERDFVCPAKRARRSEEFLIGGAMTQQQLQVALNNSVDDTVLLRKHQHHATDFGGVDTNSSLERFLAYEACSRDSLGSQQRSSTGSRRLDEFYSDSDSLSYHSLSRSSSLIQFESLERQLLLQEQHVNMSNLGNSSPSLLGIDGNGGSTNAIDDVARNGANSGSNSGNNSRRGSQSSLLKRFESSDGRLHQTYIDLDKLNFDDEEQILFRTNKSNMEAHIGELKSDSESSTSSGSNSSGNTILTTSKPSAEDLTDSSCNRKSKTALIAAFQRGGKNSAENLSEDSGYCEPSNLKRSKSKSIPKNFEKFCEEDEEFQQEYEVNGDTNESLEDNVANEEIASPSKRIHSKSHSNDSHNATEGNTSETNQPKINLDATFVVLKSNTEAFNETFRATSPTALMSETILPQNYDIERVKNSPPRMNFSEQCRSLAHSPSPVLSETSTTGSSNSSHTTRSSSSNTASESTCASAASFTWLPIQRQKQAIQQQLFQIQPKETLGEFGFSLRNSLPDIRDALRTEFSFSYYRHQLAAENDYGLEHSKAKNVEEEEEDAEEEVLDTADISISSSSSPHESCSDATADTDETAPQIRRRCDSQSKIAYKAGECERRGSDAEDCVNYCTLISSVPNELSSLGRKKRTTKWKSSKLAAREVNTSASDSSDEAEEYDFFDNSTFRIRRCSSLSERRERNLQRLHSQSLGYMNASYQNLTLLDYSDKVTPSDSSENYKRGRGLSNMEKRKSNNSDVESIICKDNFLLDELSEIYDRNVSILNDEFVEESVGIGVKIFQEPLMRASIPKAPMRQRKHSNSSHSDAESGGDHDIHHVQLTIRKPPARQKRRTERNAEATNSLIVENSTPIMTTFGKSFDQDPTNLRTSYAQSLEKCNFDAKEISNSDLTNAGVNITKRRFQSQAGQAKKRTLVSSTPNLNAYNPNTDDMEDDMYVSSAHTSMHTLPQGNSQKPLGILLPAGSRTSFSKEVSFCPVVSKYCWQEQSSEECNEPQLQRQDGQDGNEGAHHEEKEESEDELLDNADATVIYNTKENEMIAARYKEEKSAAKILRETMNEKQIEREAQTEQNIAENTLKTSQSEQPATDISTTKTKQLVDVSPTLLPAVRTTESEVSLKTTIADVATHISGTKIDNSSENQNSSEVTKSIETAFASAQNEKSSSIRPKSLHLPILSEPPINRSHHILYASQQLIDNCQAREQIESEKERSVGGAPVVSVYAKAVSVGNLNIGQTNRGAMSSNYAKNISGSEANVIDSNKAGSVRIRGRRDEQTFKPTVINNNNEVMKSKFKADEKHPNSKGFLSRFANGFRFSLRRNKKKQLEQQQQKDQQQPEQNGKLSKANTKTSQADVAAQRKGVKMAPDYLYIPLKGPLPAKLPSSKTAPTLSTSVSSLTPSSPSTSEGNLSATNKGGSSPQIIMTINEHGIYTKHFGAIKTDKQQRPEPQNTTPFKVTGKPPLPKTPPRSYSLTGQQSPQNTNLAHAQSADGNNISLATSSLSKFKPTSKFYTDNDFLEAERSYYYDDFKNQLNSGMQANGCEVAGNDSVSITQTATVPAFTANATQPPSYAVNNTTNNSVIGNGSVRVVSQTPPKPLRSDHCKIGLIETNLDTHETVITGKTRSLVNIAAGPQQIYGQRLNMSNTGRCVAADNDTYIVDVIDEDGSGIIMKTTAQGGGAQIASVRRPHKSMEFLLDKENQKNVLPPENELQKSHEHNPAALSEHQLRVQASLQRLNIPDWYRQYTQNNARSPEGAGFTGYKPGNFTRKRTTESGRWVGLNSKTTSLSSLGSQRSDRSPLLLSPSAHSHHGAATHQQTNNDQHATGVSGKNVYGATRWSTSHLNSSQTSPSVSQRGSFTRGGPVNASFMSVTSGNSGVIRNSFRQPYLGWRSQEKLSQRTPHERLASSLLAQQQRTSPSPSAQRNDNGTKLLQPVTPEIQSSIKEVTSAIVHYVKDQTNPQRSRSTSPNSS